MRLNPEQIAVIKSTVARIVPAEELNGVRLYGSRVDDAKRGGDIDLMLDLAKPAANPARLRAEVSTQIELGITRALGASPKIDVLVRAPNLKDLPIHRMAIEHGVAL
ncbi:MAG: hypothetical protein QM533_01160 [Cytophagales bacterium]|nr:hypothetical protein [Cytophagales bacterium]